MIAHNRKVSDEQVIQAMKDSGGNQTVAAKSLSIARSTLQERLIKLKHREPKEDRPNSLNEIKAKTLVITSAVSGAPINKGFYDSISVFCELNSAQLVTIPIQYDWNDVKIGKEVPTYPKELKDTLCSSDIMLNDHLALMGSVPIHATIQNPLTGMKHVSKNKSAIFAHPQRAMESVATPKSKLPKLLYTTGAITEPRYTNSKQGRKAKDLHTNGALVLTLKNDKFHIFEITADESGGFYFLDEYYSIEGCRNFSSIPAIYMPDEHEEFYPDDVKEVIYGEGGVVEFLRPDLVVRGDVYNHGSDSHHGRNNVLERIIRHSKGMSSVQQELDSCFDHINGTTSSFRNIIVASNHHDHLKRWLNEANPHTMNPENILLWHRLNADMIEASLNGESVDPFELYGRLYNRDAWDKCIFIKRDSEFEIEGVDVSMHGDIGANGARGSAVNLSFGGQPVVIGHSHSPKIYRNVYQVGATAMDMGYNKGYSSWMVTMCLIYPDGNRTLLHVIDGEWK